MKSLTPAILIVDDHPSAQRLADAARDKSPGHEVLLANSREEADQVLKFRPVEAVVLGNFSQKSGGNDQGNEATSLANSLRRTKRNFPILFVTEELSRERLQPLHSAVFSLHAPSNAAGSDRLYVIDHAAYASARNNAPQLVDEFLDKSLGLAVDSARSKTR